MLAAASAWLTFRLRAAHETPLCEAILRGLAKANSGSLTNAQIAERTDAHPVFDFAETERDAAQTMLNRAIGIWEGLLGLLKDLLAARQGA
jgi:hypothetical protein